MIPTIGLIIGGYAILRSVDLMCRSKDTFASPRARMFVILCAIGDDSRIWSLLVRSSFLRPFVVTKRRTDTPDAGPETGFATC